MRDYQAFSLTITDPEERIALAATLTNRILHALGFTSAPQILPAEGLDAGLATWASLPAGQPLAAMHIFTIPFTPDFNPEDDDLLNLAIAPGKEITWAAYLSATLFPSPHAPRWVLLAYPSQMILLDRSRFAAQRYLRFDWPAIFNAHDVKTYRAALTLLHPSALIPGAARPLHDSLEENSHKNAAAASENLKYAVREAIELLGNEVIYFRRQQKLNIYDDIQPEALSRECLRWLYRLLFLFYVESRKESLQLLEQQGDDFHLAYTLEGLRPLAEIELHSEESRDGHYLGESLDRLFQLIYQGFESGMTTDVNPQSFRRPALTAKLFDLEETPILTRTRLRNCKLQQILRLLSLDSPKGSKHKHRISYHSLGINQLGSVYEGLLSYTGQFAKEDLYEVRPAPGKPKPTAAADADADADDQTPKASAEDDPLAQVWFVNKAALANYKPAEIVSRNGRPIKHDQGTFLYRLASRNRQKSASYYTPEILTSCLVKYTLQPLLEGKSADDILNLTVCEPALGSGAFLNEAINQLTEAYIERKHREIGGELPSPQERQKVKAFLADNRVFGIDLNPIAIELAEISLWLNSLYPKQTIPYFGAQLFCGNSLVGARRQVFNRAQLTGENCAWLSSVPDRVPLGELLPEGAAWHFLLPNKGMAAYNSKVVKPLYPEDAKRLTAWSKEFNRPLNSADQRSLARLSAAVDRLWFAHAESLQKLRESTANVFPIYGQEQNPAFAARNQQRPVAEREKILRDGLSGNSPYQRLKLALDYWCALWFWPIEASGQLPTRDEFWTELLSILEGETAEVHPLRPEQTGLSFEPAFRKPTQASLEAVFESGLGQVDLKKLVADSLRLQLVQKLTERHRFFHWELEFADLFRTRGGFDLTLGNPPWIKLEWKESDVIADFNPLFLIRGEAVSDIAKRRAGLFNAHPDLESAFRDEFVYFEGIQGFFNASQNYPILKGSQSNTFKCFITNSWNYSSPGGVQGFVHPEGAFDDPKGGVFRQAIYPRLRYHFQFQNELGLFTEVHNETLFSLNVYGPPDKLSFLNFGNLFHPSTIEESMNAESSVAPCGGIKTDSNKWNIAGHPDRAVRISETELTLFARIFDKPGTTPLAARLPSLHTRTLIAVLEKFAAYPNRLSDLNGQYLSTECWHETNDRKEPNPTMRRETRFPASPSEWIVSGPHIFVANPFFQTPRSVCETNRANDLLDLVTLPLDYLPRTNYVPAADPATYLARTPVVPWDARMPFTAFYRFVARKMLSQAGERTLLGGIVFPGPAHIDGCTSLTFRENSNLLKFAAASSSLLGDFFVKSMGKANMREEVLQQLFYVKEFQVLIAARTLLLNCLTSHYAPLWQELFSDGFPTQCWAKRDHRLLDSHFSSLTPEWTPTSPLRTAFARRQALLELDVLAAQALGLTLEELLTIYRIQFPVFRDYERNTYYDQTGRIAYLGGDQGYGFSTPEWKKIQNMTSGVVTRTIVDNTLPTGPVERTIEYHAPFDPMNREADYAEAWAFFEAQPK